MVLNSIIGARLMRLLTLLFAFWSPALLAEESMKFEVPDNVAARQVDIYSEGTRMTGYVFTPKAAEGKLPVIIMGHGWGGVQAQLRRDAIEFAQADYMVVTFDYRGWGESDSRVILAQPAPDPDEVEFTAKVRAIREVVDPLDQTADWLNVLHWIHGEEQADIDNIGIWGSSMGGSLVINAAAHDPRVKAVHSQVTGGLDGSGWGRSPESRAFAARLARGEVEYPEPGDEVISGLRGAPIPHRFGNYVPIEDIRDNDSVALQFVLSETEEYLDNEEHGIRAYKQHQGPKNLVVIPGISHYDIYGKAREQSHQLAQAWFDKHLKGE